MPKQAGAAAPHMLMWHIALVGRAAAVDVSDALKDCTRHWRCAAGSAASRNRIYDSSEAAALCYNQL
jgi:hypothetical protein